MPRCECWAHRALEPKPGRRRRTASTPAVPAADPQTAEAGEGQMDASAAVDPVSADVPDEPADLGEADPDPVAG